MEEFLEDIFKKINDLKYLLTVTEDEKEKRYIINEIKIMFKSIEESRNFIESRGREITLKELEKYDGTNNNPIYVAVNGTVYDLTGVKAWENGSHMDLKAGKDLTEEFKKCHNDKKILQKLRIVGFLVE